MSANNQVIDYIKSQWDKTIRDDVKNPGHNIISIRKPYTVPCPDVCFTSFFYWDTYFANLGLLLSGRAQQVDDNLNAMKDFVEYFGYVPNCTGAVNRSQPPVFTRGVYDLYRFTGERGVIEKFIDALMLEINFFRTDRTTPCGLAAYRHCATNADLDRFYTEISARLQLSERDREYTVDRRKLSADWLGIAESGWDFNPRFVTEESRFASSEFAHLDLNCLMYDAERKISEMLAVVGRDKEAKEYAKAAGERKALIDKYMRDEKTGIYYDYNFRKGTLSETLSCASLYVYDVGISDDREAARAILSGLELPYGLSTCPYRGEDTYFQWDYPSMWPSNVFFAVCGLYRIGLTEDATRIAGKYMRTVEKSFEKTGQLWEKYDATKGELSVCLEYETPPMLGWTAGVYMFLSQCFDKNAKIPVTEE